MKRFIDGTMAMKSFACMCFTGACVAYGAISWFFGQRSLPYGMLLQFLALSILTSVLQFVFFSGNVVKKMRYAFRMAWFAIPLYLLVSAFALGFQWFPLRVDSWLLFTGVFAVVLAVLAVVFALYARISGRQYNQLLDEYKARAR